MNVLIIEDEALIARSLEKALKEIDDTVSVLSVLDSVASSVKYLQTQPQPDLIFMDIQLSDGISFDIFNQVKVECPIIFNTAYNEYAIRAFKVNSVDYLLKPIDKIELTLALDKFKKLFQSNTAAGDDMKSLISSYFDQNKIKYKERFLVPYKNGLIPILADKVSCFLKEQIIYLLNSDGQKYATDYNTIDEIEDIINPAIFFRANRQTILHINAVAGYQKHHTGKLEVTLLHHPLLIIDVSREKASEFKAWIES